MRVPRAIPYLLLVLATHCGPRTVAADASDPDVIVQIASAGAVSCALRANGRVSCWGRYPDDPDAGVNANPLRATELPGVRDAVEVGVGEWSDLRGAVCVRRSDHSIACWRCGSAGCEERGTELGVFPDATQLAVGARHACLLRMDGGVMCWGINHAGAIGDGTFVDRAAPTAVVGVADAVQVSAGQDSTCAVHRDGHVSCWGSAHAGQLGSPGAPVVRCLNDTWQCSPSPVRVVDVDDAVEVSLGLSGACARKQSGTLACWGWNRSGQIGDGTTMDRGSPVPVVGITDATTVYRGYLHTAARHADGRVSLWGYVGIPPAEFRSITPLVMPAWTSIAGLSGGWYFACALSTRGEVTCLGGNFYGELGDGTRTPRSTPTRVQGL